MEELIERSNLNVNSWLIYWGAMRGTIKDGIIEKTKFGLFTQSFCLSISSFTAIKFATLLFHPKESKIVDQLGDWGPFVGPKVFIDGMATIIAVYIITCNLLFYFHLKNSKKMLFWVEAMEFDYDNRRFKKLDLNESDSKMFIKRMSIFKFGLKSFLYSFIIFFIIVNVYSVFKYRDDYYIHYFISIFLFVLQQYFNIGYIYGLFIILYLVNHCHR